MKLDRVKYSNGKPYILHVRKDRLYKRTGKPVVDIVNGNLKWKGNFT